MLVWVVLGAMSWAYLSGWIGNSFAIGLVVLVLFFVLNLVVNQESILYVPEIEGMKTTSSNPEGFRSPDEQNLKFEEIYLPVPGEDGLELHAWFLPAPKDVATVPTVLFCHENAGNIGMRLQEFKMVHIQLGVNQLVFDYRGYGSSRGRQKPSEPGLIADARAALAHLHAKAARGEIDQNKIILSGRSLGGAVVLQLASAACAETARVEGLDRRLHAMKRGFAAVIVENEMVDHMFPFFKPLGFLKKLLLRLQWRSIDVIHLIDVPLLMLSSDKDEIVPNDHMHRLKAAASGSSALEMHTFANATHNDIFQVGGQRYWNIKRDFMNRVAQAESSCEMQTPVMEMHRTDLEMMKASELKELASRYKIDISGCYEKAEIVDRLAASSKKGQ